MSKYHINSPDEIDDDIYLEYGRDALYGSERQVYPMDDLDEIVSSSEEAIRLAQIGYDYPMRQDDFSTNRSYFTFSLQTGGLVSISDTYLLDYLKENLDEDDLYKYLDENDLIYHEDGYWEKL